MQYTGAVNPRLRVAVTSMGILEATQPPYNLSSTVDSARNMRIAIQSVEAAAAAGADLAILGETFACSGMNLQQMKEYAEEQDKNGHPDLRTMKQLAQRLSMNLIGGFFLKEKNVFRNTAIFLNREGKLLGHYYKSYPVPEELEAGVLPGNEMLVFDSDVGRVGVFICFDLNWPYLAAGMTAKGADYCVWLSAYDGGLPLKVAAMTNKIPILSAVMGYKAKVIDATGRVRKETSRWERLAVHDLCIRDAFGLFHMDNQAESICRAVQTYGGKIHIEVCEEEHLWSIDVLDPALSIEEIKQQLSLVTYSHYIAECTAKRNNAMVTLKTLLPVPAPQPKPKGRGRAATTQPQQPADTAILDST